MNIITAAKAHKEARDTLFADYTAEHVSTYTAAAITYSDHRERALWAVGQLLAFAGAALALYNMIQANNDNANYILVGLTLGLLVASVVVHRYKRRIDRAVVDTINALVLMAEYEAAPNDVILRRLPPQAGENH